MKVLAIILCSGFRVAPFIADFKCWSEPGTRNFRTRNLNMATIKSFEDIEAWKKARRLSSDLFQIFTHSPARTDFALRDQMNRSAGSVMDNIAEGFDRGGNREFINFLSIAKGSAAETQSQLYRLFDRQYISREEFDRLYKESSSIARMLGAMISYLKKSEFKGPKFHE